MSIFVNVVTLAGIALASDGRRLLADPNESTKENIDIEVLGDDYPKIHLLCGRYGLSYSGISRLPYGKWDFVRDILPTMEKILGTDKYIIADAAAELNKILSEVLIKGYPQEKKWFSFSLCGYENQDALPVLVQYADGELKSKIGYFRDRDGFLGGIICAGYTDHIDQFTKTNKIEVTRISITEALSHAEFLVNLEIEAQERCGGQVYLAIITRNQCGAIGRLPTGESYIKEDD